MKLRTGYEIEHGNRHSPAHLHPDVAAARARRAAYEANASTRASREAARLRQCRLKFSGIQVAQNQDGGQIDG